MVRHGSFRNKKRTAFTITEVIIVVLVIAILSAISVLAYRDSQKRSYDAAIASDLSSFNKVYKVYSATYGSSAGDAQPDGMGVCSNNSISSVATLFSNNSFSFSRGPYGSMNTQATNGLVYAYYPVSLCVQEYVCIAVRSLSGKPIYWSSERGVFEPNVVGGTQANNDLFPTGCRRTGYITSKEVYGPFNINTYAR
jgi:type II secretory pathway pseudopilin PulG